MECECVIKQRALAYLTPTYQNAQYAKQFRPEAIRGKNLLLEGTPLNRFKTIVKSFLLNTGMIYTHKTVSAYDILQAYLTNSETREFYSLSEQDILILFLVHDPANRSYGQIISSLLQARELKGKNTWVYTSQKADSPGFGQMYGLELVDALKELNFTALQ